MTDPFTLVKSMAETLGMTPFMVSIMLAIVAAIMGFTITSLMAGNPARAFKFATTGFAVLVFFLFSQIAAAIGGI